MNINYYLLFYLIELPLNKNITGMMNKVVGYSGFRTYGEVDYPTRKQGKELELQNKIWSDTVRPIDHKNPIDNFKNAQSVYKNSFLQNTRPQNYHPQHVVKGMGKTLDFTNVGSIKAFDREEAQRYGTKTGDQKFLKSGTQHWKSNYQQMSRKQGPFTQTQTMRSASLGGKSSLQIAEEESKSKSFKHRPYINNAKIGVSDYKFNYGQGVGSTPLDLMNRVSFKQPLRDNPLKKGTNQLWSQIPNYQGFKPSALQFKEYQKKIEERGRYDKGQRKLQTTENFLVNVPGYGGYKPTFENQGPKLRSNCLSTN